LLLAFIVRRYLTGCTLYIKFLLKSQEISPILIETFCVLHPQSSCLISFFLRTTNLLLVKMLQHKCWLSTMYSSVHFSDGSSVWVWKRRTVNREIVFVYFVQRPTNAKLIDKLLHW